MDNLDNIKKELKELIVDSVKNQVKNLDGKNIGVLFSGGIDSTIIAFVLKNLGKKFTCYCFGLDEPGLKAAEDIVWAKKVALSLGFNLKIINIDLVKAVTNVVSIPVIASGGMGKLDDIDSVVKEGGADAVAMAHLLHYEHQHIDSVRNHCIEKGIPVRQYSNIDSNYV